MGRSDSFPLSCSKKCCVALSEEGEGRGAHHLPGPRPSMFLAIGRGSQVTQCLPSWPVAFPLAVALLDHLHLQPQFQSWRGQEVGPSLGFSAESHPSVLPWSWLGVAALRWSAEALLLPVSCTKPSLPPEGAGVRSSAPTLWFQLPSTYASRMRWLLLDKTLLCTSDYVYTHFLALHSAHSGCSHFTVKEIEASGAGTFQAKAVECMWEEELVAWWHAPAACRFLRCLNVVLTGITHEARRPPRNCGRPLSTYCKGEILTHLLRVDSFSHPPMAGPGGTQSGKEKKSRLSNYFSLCSDKISKKSKVRKEGLVLSHGLRMQSIMAGKAWCQEREAAGHMTPSQEAERDEHWGSAHLHQSGTPACAVVPPSFRVSCSSSMNSI